MEGELVRIEPALVLFPPTYITATTRFTLKIINDSDKTLHFTWTNFSNEDEERKAVSALDNDDPAQRREYERILRYNSEFFVPLPRFGEVWPHREKIVEIDFSPMVAEKVEEVAYLVDDVLGKRHNVLLRGVGLSPDAHFDVDTINIGHLPLESVCEYSVNLLNTGKVPVEFEISNYQKRSGFSFSFVPTKGVIDIGKDVKIKVIFLATAVGQFNEIFEFNVRGSATFRPSLTIYGKIIGPEFIISKKILNFGDVSYGFLYSQQFEIENKSEIPFDYACRLEQDNSFSPREFNITRMQGTIPKFGKELITVEFVPITVQNYDIKLDIDILKVGRKQDVVNIVAVCFSPSLSIKGGQIDFGKVFIGQSYTKLITVVDDTDFPAKFEFVLPEEASVSQALISVSRPRGVIIAHQEFDVEITMTAQILGPLNVTGYIRTFGSNSAPIPFSIKGLSTGPNISINPQYINYGMIPVLTNISHKITIVNDSLIPAPFATQINSDYPSFKIEPKEGEIPPNETLVAQVIANLDDTLSFNGKVLFNFKNLNPLSVDLNASGTGNPIVSSIPMDKEIDFEYVLNEQTAVKKFTLKNHGRRSQEIRWTVNKAQTRDEAVGLFKFQVVPEQLVISPSETAEFAFTVQCPIPTSFAVPLLCNATIGRQRVELFSPRVVGIVIKPLLSFSKNLVEFVHRHDYVAEEKILREEKKATPSLQLMPSQAESITVKNLVQLPLDVTIEHQAPFTVNPYHFIIEPQSTQEIEIIFELSFKNDFGSEQLNRKLTFCFKNHPQKLYVNVKAQLVFPNLSFEPSMTLNFGNLLLNTEQTKDITISSTPDSGAEWNWQLVSDDQTCDICRIFDVFPTRGKIEAGQTDEVHFSFFAYGGDDGRSATYNACAVCHIMGGPDYVINLSGSAAAINYKVDPTEIDFGDVSYDHQLTKAITISNESDVSIFYNTKISKSCKFSKISITPSEGTIGVGNSLNLNLSILCGLPQSYHESFVIQIGHYEEIKIELFVNAHFTQISLPFPRSITDPATLADESSDDLQEAEKKIMISRLSDRLLSLTMGNATRRRRGNDGQFTGYINSQYYYDVGEITIGEVREFDFVLTSLTPYPISFTIRGDVLAGSGFSIDPGSASQIPALSDFPMKLIFDTAQHTINSTGEVKYDILFEFSEDLAVMATIRAFLRLPSLKFSKLHFDFDDVVVGQMKVMTLQLQNMNTVSCEFEFGEEQQLNATNVKKTPKKKKQQKKGKEAEEEEEPPEPVIFISNPPTGILPPSAFQNIELTFTPVVGQVYQMQIPVYIKHNNQSQYITLTGKGVQLRVEFDPPSLVLPSIKPFSDPSVMDVTLINPTNYPIEVFSYQFDWQLFVDNFKKKGETPEDTAVTFTQNASVNKFSICAIVHSADPDECSRISTVVAKYLNNVPIIDLKELWTDELAAADYTGSFFNRISQPDCADGFVVNSLNVIKEPAETDQFLMQCLKGKNVVDDAMNNPFNAIPHQHLTSVELALQYILAALDGHYLFFIGIRSDIDLINKKIEQQKKDERKRKALELEQEKNGLFNMDEDQYLKLSPEEQEHIDKKRKSWRKKQILAQEEAMKAKEKDKHKKHSHRSKKDDESSKEAPAESKNKRRKPQIPTDPMEHAILFFNMIVGSLVQKMRETSDNYQAIDPKALQLAQELTNISMNSILFNPEDKIEEGIRQFVPTIQMLKEAAFTNLIPPPRTENLIQNTPKTRYLESPPYFFINNPDPVPELPDFDEPPQTTVVKRRAPTRKGKKQATVSFNFDIAKLTPRWKIDANSTRVLSIKFDATMIGTYKSDLLFGLVNCQCDVLKLTVSGLCAYPAIERSPKVIFDKRVMKPDNKTEFAYCVEPNEFVFGPVLIAKDKATKTTQALYHQVLHINNPSPFPAELTSMFREPSGKTFWGIDPVNITIAPQQTSDVTICVHPMAADVSKNQLTLFVKDQPEPLMINFSVEGCTPSIECSTTSIDFDKLLLEQSRTLSLDIKNTSKLGCYWRLKKEGELKPTINFSANEGEINTRGTVTLKATFTSSKPVVIKKTISLEILDKEKTRVFNTIPINVTAEAFDVTIDFQYPKGFDHLQYSSIKVQQSKTITCLMKNKGKFPVKFRVDYDQKALQSLFTIQPNEGTMNSNDKPLNMNFIFKSNKVVTYTAAKGLTLVIQDPLTKTTTCKLPLPFSVETVYSSFSISPKSTLQFGATPCNIPVNKQIQLKNDGKFPFDFEISGRIDDPPKPVNPKDKKKAAPPPKPRGKKGGTHIQVGNYTIMPSTGTLQPNMVLPIDIEFLSPTDGENKATLFFKITDSDPTSNQDDRAAIKFFAESVTPGLEVTNKEMIFPGTHLCLRSDLARMNKTAYLEGDEVLHFEPMILQRRESVEVVLINPYPVPCTVDISIKPKTKAGNSNFPFDVNEKMMTLESKSQKSLTLGFLPVTCDSFTALFEAIVRGGGGDSKVLKFSVEGIGTLPNVILDAGLDKDKGKGNSFTCNLGRVLLGFTKEKGIRIANEGVIPAHCTLNIKPNPDFIIDNIDSWKDFVVDPGKASTLIASFKPQKARKAQIDLSLTIQDNPKAGMSVSLVGEGSSEDVIFEGLSNNDGDLLFKDCIVGRQQQAVFSIKNVGATDIRFTFISQHSLQFSPRVGHLHSNKQKQITVSFFSDHPLKQNGIKITCQIQKIELAQNNSPDWDDSMKSVNFVSKQSLMPEQPPPPEPEAADPKAKNNTRPSSRKLSAKRGKEQESRIEKTPEPPVVEPKIEKPPELVKIIEVRPEPPFNIINAAEKPKELTINVNAIADYIKYSIDTSDISFSPTMMYQKRFYEVKMTNTCQIRFDYTWRVIKFVSHRTDYAQNRLPPFNVLPVSGFIEPGQTTIFKVIFLPEEVDDFTAQLQCDIPYLSQMDPPVIDVSGLSRRPLCHFNVELSDYLTRRHPDYTNRLPDDVKVIEMFSKGIGAKTIKKFELINPTSAPYEMNWAYLGEGATPFFCETQSGLISSGKTTSVSFGYLPTSVKTVESLWEFQIPEHSVRVSFLFVGRIMP